MANADVDDIALEDVPPDGRSGERHSASERGVDLREVSLSRDDETPANRSETSATTDPTIDTTSVTTTNTATDIPNDLPPEGLPVLPPEGTASISVFSCQVSAHTSADAAVFESYPDGGAQAWLQVFYCFCIFFTTLGGIYCWGVFQDALFAEGLAPSSALAFIGSTQATLEAVFAIPISRIVARYGPKRIAIVGGLLSGLGPILAGSCTRSFGGMMITEVRLVRLERVNPTQLYPRTNAHASRASSSASVRRCVSSAPSACRRRISCADEDWRPA